MSEQELVIVATPGFIGHDTAAQNVFIAQSLNLLGHMAGEEAEEPISWVIGDPERAPDSDIAFEDERRTARVYASFRAYAILDYGAGPDGKDLITFLLPHEY